MLLALATILFVLWVAALAFKVTFGLVHLALVVAVILFIAHFARGRMAGPRRTV